MNKRISCFIVLFLLFSTTIGSTLKVSAATDETAPTVKSIELDKETVQPGDQIKFSMEAEDLESGITGRPVIKVERKTNVYTQGEFVYFTYNVETKRYEGNYTVPSDAVNGEWFVSWVSLEDKAGNVFYDFPAEGDPLYLSFIVTGGSNDTTPPTVKSVEIDLETAQPGDQIKFSIVAEDLESGITGRPVIKVERNTNVYTQGEFVYFTYNAETKKYEGTYMVPSDAVNGEYFVSWISIEDSVGNVYYDFPAEGDPLYVSFIVTGGGGDITPPTVKSIEFDKDLVQPGDQIKFSIVAEDLESGITGRPVIKVERITSNYTQGEFVYFTYNAETKKYEGIYSVPSDAVNGEWFVSWISIEDKAGNVFYDFPSVGSKFYLSFNVSDDVIPPKAPNITAITDQDTTVSAVTEAHAHVTIKAGTTVIGSGIADDSGQFSISIPKQTSGTKIFVIATDLAGNESITELEVITKFSKINIQLNGIEFTQGYFGKGTTYVHWQALNTLKIPYTFEGNGIFKIEGRTVTAETINGGLYINWNELSPGNVTFTRITGGYNFIYKAPAPAATPLKVQLNGKDFTAGFFKDGNAYVHWQALNTFKIPFTFKGNNVFIIEGRTVVAENINGGIYIRWNLLSPGNVTFQKITGGYNFIYKAPAPTATPLKVQLNGQDFTAGFFKDGNAYVHWQALNTFKIPFTFKGNNVFIIEGRTATAETINGGIYIRWNELSPGNVTFERITGGYNFIYTN
ncbi:Ig-like domain-containing protein [Neobacillus sp. CF12]|uniref:Ig-like domain-containing protein n=1 Tax=Neobacillus sp. CF12 TaxID=3055864 RepID=UPI0025A240FB|nr:Ig-like domain-containing protein [Neobacillus sp. CF12]MDM5329799.1 Ig-like domain-containing protein [Neobacillus sp. CF12]